MRRAKTWARGGKDTGIVIEHTPRVKFGGVAGGGEVVFSPMGPIGLRGPISHMGRTTTPPLLLFQPFRQRELNFAVWVLDLVHYISAGLEDNRLIPRVNVLAP
jgi:hypothetical protein